MKFLTLLEILLGFNSFDSQDAWELSEYIDIHKRSKHDKNKYAYDNKELKRVQKAVNRTIKAGFSSAFCRLDYDSSNATAELISNHFRRRGFHVYSEYNDGHHELRIFWGATGPSNNGDHV